MLEPDHTNSEVKKVKASIEEFPDLQSASFPEVLFFTNLLQRRAEITLENFSCLQNLKDLFASARKLPFPTRGILGVVAQRVYNSIGIDILLKSCISVCQPTSAYNPSKNQLGDEPIRKNQDSQNQLIMIQSIYLKDFCRVRTKGYDTVVAYFSQLDFLADFYHQVGEHTTKQGQPSQMTTPNKLKKGYEGTSSPSQQFIGLFPSSLMKELHAKAVNLGLNDELEESKLLRRCTSDHSSVNQYIESSKIEPSALQTNSSHGLQSGSKLTSDTLRESSDRKAFNFDSSSEKLSLAKSSGGLSSTAKSRGSEKEPFQVIS